MCAHLKREGVRGLLVRQADWKTNVPCSILFLVLWKTELGGVGLFKSGPGMRERGETSTCSPEKEGRDH